MLIKDLYASITHYLDDRSITQFILIYDLNVNINFKNKYKYNYYNYFEKIRPNKISVYNSYVNLSLLPSYVTHLYLNPYVIKFRGIMPENVTHVILWNTPHKDIIGRLPKSLKYLELNSIYDEFSFNFDSSGLPRNLTHFICNCDFNGYLNDLPDSLTHLTISNDYSKPIRKLPKSLKQFSFNDCTYEFVNNVSNYITHLSCVSYCIGECPKYLQHLEIKVDGHLAGNDYDLKEISNSLKSLTFGEYFNGDISHLPHRLKMLTFGSDFNQSVDNLPKTLIFLKFGSWFNKNVNNLPVSIEVLIFGYQFNSSVNNLPPNLKYLEFGTDFNRSVNYLPPNIIYLSFGYCFEKSLKHLPKSIKYLKLVMYFNKSLMYLPDSIVHLALDYDFLFDNYLLGYYFFRTEYFFITNLKLPQSLRYLYLTKTNNLAKYALTKGIKVKPYAMIHSRFSMKVHEYRMQLLKN